MDLYAYYYANQEDGNRMEKSVFALACESVCVLLQPILNAPFAFDFSNPKHRSCMCRLAQLVWQNQNVNAVAEERWEGHTLKFKDSNFEKAFFQIAYAYLPRELFYRGVI